MSALAGLASRHEVRGMSALAALASRLKFGAVGAVVEVRCGDSICSGTMYLQRKNVSAAEQCICGGKPCKRQTLRNLKP